MTVRELAELYIKSYENVEIWECASQETVYKGTFNEAEVCEYSDNEVTSFGIEDGIIVINI